MNLAEIFLAKAEKQPTHTVVIGRRGERMTYAQLADQIELIAKRLKLSGLLPGVCIGLHYPSGGEYIALNYAIWRCGACVVPIPTELTLIEKQDICRQMNIDAVISRAEVSNTFTLLQKASPKEIGEKIVLITLQQAKAHPSGFKKINSAFLRFTSGTTGDSKGVVLSHETIYERIHAANEALQINSDDKIIWLLSMAYHFAVSIVAYLTFGATIVLPKNYFGATVIQTVNEQAGTLIYGAPMQYELMAHDTSEQMLPTLRLAISTTASLSNSTAEAFYQRFKHPLNQAYGIIEVGLPCINVDRAVEKQGSVGQLLPAYEILMEDIGLEEGFKMIKLRGKGLFDAYYEPWQTRQEAMPQGWFVTGDLGVLDEDGYLFIRGRRKEIINVSGMKFFPKETEEVLQSHPDIAEACVFAHQDERLGETPYAQVVLNSSIKTQPTEIELKDYCLKKLASYKIPQRIFFVDKLVRTGSGKLIRDEKRIIEKKE